MNPGSPDSEFGNSIMHDFIVPKFKRRRLQEAFVEFNHAADTLSVRDDEMTSWLGNPSLQAENEIPDVNFSSLMENISDEFVDGEQQLTQPVTGLSQQAETTLGQPDEFVHGEQLAVTEATPWQNNEFLHGEHQLIQPVTADELQQLIQGLPQQAEAIIWPPEPAVNQPVTTPVPQAENALWPVLEPPLDVSDYLPLVVAAVEGKKEGGSTSIVKKEKDQVRDIPQED